MRNALIALAALGAAACGQTATSTDNQAEEPQASMPQTAEEATAQDTCGASGYASIIGANIAATSFPADANIRVIQPDSVVTEDFRPDRLNVIVDENGIITALRCY